MSINLGSDGDLGKEAQAFDQRLIERTNNNFIPDITEATDNDFFYKSFWRRKEYVDLYFGHLASNYIDVFIRELKPGSTILDFGCGPGYFCLELARAGFNVIGCDIASHVINTASTYACSLDDKAISERIFYTSNIEDLKDHSIDAVLCSGVLHHLKDLNKTLSGFHSLFKSKEDAVLLFHEPFHRSWSKSDAFIVATIRYILSQSGNWYEDLEFLTQKDFGIYVDSVFEEYVMERDPSEKEGQSPNDLSCDFESITAITSAHFNFLDTWPSRAFIYRCMGGVRSNPSQESRIARALEIIDSFGVASNSLKPNYMYGLAKGLKN